MQFDVLKVPESEKESDALPEEDGLLVTDSLLETDMVEDVVPDLVVVVEDVIVTLCPPVLVDVVLAVMVSV